MSNESEIVVGMRFEADAAPFNQEVSKATKAVEGLASSSEKIPQNMKKAAESSEQLVTSSNKRRKAEKGVTQEVNKQGKAQQQNTKQTNNNANAANKKRKAEHGVTQEVNKQNQAQNQNLRIQEKQLQLAIQQERNKEQELKLQRQLLKEQTSIDKNLAIAKKKGAEARLTDANTRKNISSPSYKKLADIAYERKDIVNEKIRNQAALAEARRKQIEAGLGSRFTQNWRGGIAAAISGLSTRAKGKSGLTGMMARYGEQSWNKTRVMKSGTMSGKGVGLGAIKGFIVGNAFSKLGKAIVSLSESALKAYGSIEKLKISLGVVFGSEVQANTAFQGIKEYAVRSPFGAEQTTEMAVLLKQSGVYGYELLDTLKMIGDVSGGNEEKMKRIANNYAQIASIGKASMLDMRQFAYAGIPIYKAVAEELGVSQQVLRNMIADGKVTNDVMEKVFKNLTSESGMFYKATEKGAESLNARLTNLKDAATFALGGAGQFLMNIGNSKGEGGLITEVIGITENILQYLEKSVSTLNLEKTVKQIEKNDTEQARLRMLIEATKDNPELKKYLEAQLLELQKFIPEEKKLATEGEIYYKERERLQTGLSKETHYRSKMDALAKGENARLAMESLIEQQKQALAVGDSNRYEILELQIEEQERLVELAQEEYRMYQEIDKLREKNNSEVEKSLRENEAKYGLSASYVAAQNFTTTQMEMLADSSDEATGLSVVAGNAVLAWEQNTEEGQKQKKAREDKEYAENYKRFTEYSKALTESGNLITGFKGSLSDFYKILQSGIIKPLETIDITQLADEGGKTENQKQSRKDQWEFIGKELAKVRSSFGSEFSVEENDKLSRMAFILSQENNQANVNAFATIFRGLTEELEKSGNKELAAAIGQLMVYVREKPEWMPETNPEASGKGKDAIPELWKRIVGSATGIDASFITGGAKSFFDTYRSTFENRNLAQGGISGMTAAGKSAAEISTMLRYSGKKAKDGTLQIDWEATAEVMKDFMLSGRASVKELEEYSQAIEGQISVYDKLKETMFTTGEDWANIDPKVLEEQLVNAFSGVGASLIAVNEAGQTKEVEARDGQLYFKGTKDLVYAQNEYKMSMEKSIEAIDEASKSLKELKRRTDTVELYKTYEESLKNRSLEAGLKEAGAQFYLDTYNQIPEISIPPEVFSDFGAKFLEIAKGKETSSNDWKEELNRAFEGVFDKIETVPHPDALLEQYNFLRESEEKDKGPEISQYTAIIQSLVNGLEGYIYSSINEGSFEWVKYLPALLQMTYAGKNSDLLSTVKATNESEVQSERKSDVAETIREQRETLSIYQKNTEAISEYAKELQRSYKEQKQKNRENIKKAKTKEDKKEARKQGKLELEKLQAPISKGVEEALKQIQNEHPGATPEEALGIYQRDIQIEKAGLEKGDIQSRFDFIAKQAALEGEGFKYFGASVMKGLTSSAQGTDAGAFMQGYNQGNASVEAGIVAMLAQAILNVVEEMDYLEYALSGITALMRGFEIPLRYAIAPLVMISRLLEKAAGPLNKFFDKLFGENDDKLKKWMDTVTDANDSMKKQAELLQTLNEQMSNTLKAFKDAEEYYLTEKRHLNAQTLIEMQGLPSTQVNDMILTPHGNFSTAPDDYLLAMKDPTSLMGFGNPNVAVQTMVNVKVINQAGKEVRATASETINDKGQTELVVMISKAVANDYATGRNGWDNAVAKRVIRNKGRSY